MEAGVLILVVRARVVEAAHARFSAVLKAKSGDPSKVRIAQGKMQVQFFLWADVGSFLATESTLEGYDRHC